MFIVGVLLGLLVAVYAAPAKLDEVNSIAIGRSASENNADGSYAYNFESEKATKVDEFSSLKQVGPKPEDIGTVSRGSYSYTTPDGVVLTVNWVADENGFQATGDHLPTPPPMPEHRQINVEETDAVPRESYSYMSPDGTTFTVNWVADENGFQATGDHLPTPPPMPANF